MMRVIHWHFIPQEEDNDKEFLGTNAKKSES